MIGKMKSYWVLVADSGQARVLKYQPGGPGLERLEIIESPTRHDRTRDLKSDTFGRTYNARGPARHSLKSRTDAHDHMEQEFVRSLAGKLAKAARGPDYDELILIADPRTLGRLRGFVSDAEASRVTHQLNVNLTNALLDELERRIHSKIFTLPD